MQNSHQDLYHVGMSKSTVPIAEKNCSKFNAKLSKINSEKRLYHIALTVTLHLSANATASTCSIRKTKNADQAVSSNIVQKSFHMLMPKYITYNNFVQTQHLAIIFVENISFSSVFLIVNEHSKCVVCLQKTNLWAAQ